LRAGSPAAERRTRSRSLRGAILARPTPSCADDDDRVRLPPASAPRNTKAGKKESTGHRPSRLCQPCATPSTDSSPAYRRDDARIVENGFATSSGMNKSAKVVLRLVDECRHFGSPSELLKQSRSTRMANQERPSRPSSFFTAAQFSLEGRKSQRRVFPQYVTCVTYNEGNIC